MNSLGYREWKDGFATDNIPDSIADKTYHIATPSIVQTNHNQIHLELLETVEISLFIKGYRDPANAIDQAHTEIERSLKEVLDHSNRTQGNLKNVVMNNIDIEPYGNDNDNMVRVSMTFEASVIMDVTSV